jgi:hypothetical protein
MQALTSILMKQLAIRLSPQAGKSLVISRLRERKRPYLPLMGKSRTSSENSTCCRSNIFIGGF